MLGDTSTHAVDLATLRIGIENHVSALRANQIKRRFVALKDVGFPFDIILRHNRTITIKSFVASKAIFCRHGSGAFQAGTYGVQPVHIVIVHKIRDLRQSASAKAQARSHCY
ncbi:hypothetical protein ABUK73_21225 [Agrobacterium sp. BA1120]|uniref:hypothetical protein n=1 Tax=Agrobacterium sp. BA1120 TaxID=3228927 RepID=UPI000DE036D5